MAYMQVQIIQLVGVGQRYFDRADLRFQFLQPIDLVAVLFLDTAVANLLIGLAQVFVPAENLGSDPPAVKRARDLDQRE